MTAVYNEIDSFCADWLENQIAEGLIAPGVVDRRSIEDVVPSDYKDFQQVHLFAGIGGWSQALRGAGFPDDRRVATVSCPCQPFSAAGKGNGFADERHLWPSAFHVLRQLGFDLIFGEQVASPDGLAWLDLVCADMEGEGYTAGTTDLCAAGFGSPQIRQRQYFAFDSPRSYRQNGRLADPYDAERGPESARRHFCDWPPTERDQSDRDIAERGGDGGLVNDLNPRLERHAGDEYYAIRRQNPFGSTSEAGPTSGFWRDADFLFCRDGIWRPVKPGTFPMAHGDSRLNSLLRSYGNLIVVPQAQAFISSYLDEEAGSDGGEGTTDEDPDGGL